MRRRRQDSRERPWWLRLLPAEVREDHGDEIVEMAERERDAPRHRGVLGAVRFWIWLLLDLRRAAVRRRRHSRGLTPLQGDSRTTQLADDLRLALRRLRHRPTTAILAILTLAGALGLATATFSVVQEILLEPLGFEDERELLYVHARWSERDLPEGPVSGLDFRDLREGVDAFEDLAAVMSLRQTLGGLDVPQQIEIGWVSENFWSVLGVDAAIGRVFVDDEGPGTAILGHALWRTHFGADPEVVGTRVTLDGRPYDIVGVAPPGFRLPLPGVADEIDLWKSPDNLWSNGDVWGSREMSIFRLVGRLRDGVSLEVAREQLADTARRHRELYASHAAVGWELDAQPLRERATSDVRATLLVLLGAVGFLLVVACANVACLLLARGDERRAELGLRAALGASRRRLISLGLWEGALLAIGGGAVGVVLARQAVTWIERLQPHDLPIARSFDLDPSVLLFTLALVGVAALLSASAPAVLAARSAERGGVRLGARSGGTAGGRLTRSLVVLQVALALVLLVGAGLLRASLVNLARVDPGFERAGITSFSVALPGTRYGFPEESGRFFYELERRLAERPEIESVGLAQPTPLEGEEWSGPWTVRGGRERGVAQYVLVTPGFFETAGVPLVDGRAFRHQDGPASVLVSRSLAERLWPDRPAIGRALTTRPWNEEQEFEVIGVVEDLRYRSLRGGPTDALYFDTRHWSWTDWEVDYLVRSSLDAAGVVAVAREVLDTLDPEVPIARARPLAANVDGELAGHRFVLSLIGVFAAGSLGLAMLGLYGVLAQAVSRRRREIGVRLALGSAPAGVVRMFLGEGGRLLALGLACGLAGSWMTTRLLGSLLFGVGATDPGVLAVTSLAIVGVGLLACWAPARRAGRLDPRGLLVEE